MPHPTRPPTRVTTRTYWFRRVLVLATVAAFLFGAGKAVAWVGGSSGSPVSADPGSSSTPAAVTTPGKRKKHAAKQTAPAAPVTPQASPDGPCDPSDLVVEPLVRSAVGGGSVTIGLSITSVTSPACTFEVNGHSVVVRIVKGDQRVWSSQDCPGVLPETEVVARPEEPGFAHFSWNARYSSPGCAAATRWALPGTYRIQAAAYGSPAKTAKFDLTAPQPQTIAPTPTPSPSASPSPKNTKTRG